MFPNGYFPADYFAPRYFPRPVPVEVPAGGGVSSGGGSGRLASRVRIPIPAIRIPGRKARLPAIHVRTPQRPAVSIQPAPYRPRFDTGNEPELFAGEVQGKTASQPEERFANAMNKSKAIDSYEFRYTLGAPRGLPGWFELDYIVSVRGMVYAIECDTIFTHRNKGEADRLHDAKALKQLQGQGLNIFPQIIHLDGERELADAKSAEQTVRRLFQ